MPRVSAGTAALVRAGIAVWSPGALWAAARPTAVGGSWLRRGTQSSTGRREALSGADHRCRTLVDGLDDFGVVDPAEIRGGDRKVGMPELALDHEQRDPFAGHVDGVRVPELVWREPAADARSLSGSTRQICPLPAGSRFRM